MRPTAQGRDLRRAFDWKAERKVRNIPMRSLTLGPSTEAQIAEVLRRIHVFRRFEHIDLSIHLAVREWVNKRAGALVGQSAPDLEALRLAVRLRFSASFPSPLSPDPNTASVLETESVACLVFLVLMTLVQATENDLQAVMEQAQAAMKAKQLLRQMIQEVNKEEANLLNEESNELDSLGQVTTSLFGATYDAQAARIAGVTSVLPMPIELTPAAEVAPSVNMQALNSIRNQLQDALDSDNEVSEMTSMQLQMLMDTHAKLLRTASDMEKAFAEAAEAVVANIKD